MHHLKLTHRLLVKKKTTLKIVQLMLISLVLWCTHVYTRSCLLCRIYVCGGRDGSSCLRSLESFDPHTNKWTILTPMNRRRGKCSVTYITYRL